jgi:PAS domain S-box-containing protein
VGGDSSLRDAGDPHDRDTLLDQLREERARLMAVLEQLPLAAIIASAPDGRMLLGNQQVERILRTPFFAASDVEGYRHYQGLHPDGRPFQPEEWPLARALRAGKEIRGEEIEVLRGDGTRGVIRANAGPVRDTDGTITAGVVVFEDITESRRTSDALAFLIEASAILAASLDYEATLASVVELIVPRLADWCVVDIMAEDGSLKRLAMRHRDPAFSPLLAELEARYPHAPESLTGPARIVRSGQAELHPDVSPAAIERAARDERHLAILHALEMRSYLGVPLVARGKTLGAISFVQSTSGRRYTPGDLALAEELGRRIAIAIDNARLYEAERASRAQAERANQRLALLADASNILATSLALDSALEDVARLTVPVLADLCVIDIVAPDGTLYRPAVAHDDPQQLAFWRSFDAGEPVTIDSDAPLSRVIRRGAPVIVDRLTTDMIRTVVEDTDRASAIAAAYQSAIVLPLIRHGRPLGALSFGARDPQRFSTDDVPFVLEFAERVAGAIENAQLFAASQAAELRYRSLFEHAADAILVADGKGNYLDANPAAIRLLGYSREELLALNVADIIPAGPAWAVAEYARYVAEGYWHGELTVFRKDGSTVPVEATATVAPLADRTVYLSVIRDITERRASERLQREFMTMVTHDLKSPLTSIKGFAQLMQRRGVYSQPAVDAIVAQTAQLERLINDMLDAARLEAGQTELRRARVDLVSLGRTVIDYSQALTQQHRLHLEAPDTPLFGQWDQDRLAQVLQNLLSNAIKYSPGGRIVLAIARSEESAGPEAVVSVSDEGIGIPAEALPRVFERFYRHESAERGQPGLGLGLYISRSLIEAHGGRITVESEPGRGTTFRFTLPLYPEQA